MAAPVERCGGRIQRLVVHVRVLGELEVSGDAGLISLGALKLRQLWRRS